MISKRHTFQPRISAGLSSQLNTNFDDIINAFNSHTHTGIGTDAPVITNSGLAANNQWASYTPTWASGGGSTSIGNGSLSGRFTKIGRLVNFRVLLIWGSSTSATGSSWSFSLPTNNASALYSQEHIPIGNTYLEDKFTRAYFGPARILSTKQHYVTVAAFTTNTTYAGDGTLTSTSPFTWANGDFLSVTGAYESET